MISFCLFPHPRCDDPDGCEKELEGKLLPPSGGGESDSGEEVLEDGSNVEVWDAPGAADTGGEEVKEP